MIKMKKMAAGLLTAVMLTVLCAASAAALELVPVGRAVGIEMNTDGVLVVGLAQVEAEGGARSPAGDAGVLPGDRIVRLGAREIKNGEDFLAAVAALDGNRVSLTVRRGEKAIQFDLTPAQSPAGAWQLGLWLRDSVAGIGTVTFYDPTSGLYGALGHGICDMETGVLLPVSEGSITEAQVVDVRPGAKGTPGELCGAPNSEQTLGDIGQNTIFGIFGQGKDALAARAALPVAAERELVLGPATILSTVSGSEVQEFAVEITRVYRGDDSGRCLMVTVTDPALIRATGGIVQGMSGSPILQNGKLVGAVTHVLVNDPTRGYGISAERMLKAAGVDAAGEKAA